MGLGAAHRKRLALALLVLVAALALVAQTQGYRRSEDMNDEEEEEDEGDDEGFDFMSDSLPTKRIIEEASCDAVSGQCAVNVGGVRSVVERKLVTTKPKLQEIIREHARAGSPLESAFTGETLGYVTPWNGRGYDFARKYRAKFTYIAPVWLQIREDAKTTTPIVTGTHDIDRQWVRDVKGDGNSRPQIVPRVMYERNRLSHTDVPIIIKALLNLADKESFDGFVFEIPISKGTMDLLLRMGEAFKHANKLLLLVLARASNDGRLPMTIELLDQLEPYVHRYSMNAYDFQTPGPNAPYPWIQDTLNRFRDRDRRKILMGVPFYGYDNNDAIVGGTHVDHLRDNSDIKIRWDATAHECYYRYTGETGVRHTVYYPCLQFLQDRLQLFERSGTAGVAVWELGQGLEYFYDLL